MLAGAPLVLALATALGCGLVADVLFAFSSFVMPALGRLPAADGLAAMQAVNVAAIVPSFMAALFGTGAACVAVLAVSVTRWEEPDAPFLLAGGLVYLLGTIALTAIFHVPRNDRLARTRPTEPGAAELWARYRREWTAGNHVRAAASLAAAALLVAGAVAG